MRMPYLDLMYNLPLPTIFCRCPFLYCFAARYAYININNENGFVLPSRRSFCCSFLSCSFAKILTINLGQMQSEVKGETKKKKARSRVGTDDNKLEC